MMGTGRNSTVGIRRSDSFGLAQKRLTATPDGAHFHCFTGPDSSDKEHPTVGVLYHAQPVAGEIPYDTRKNGLAVYFCAFGFLPGSMFWHNRRLQPS